MKARHGYALLGLALLLLRCSGGDGASAAADAAPELIDATDAADMGDATADAAFDPAAVAPRTCAVDAAAVDALLAGMTRRQRVGQHLLVMMNPGGFHGLDQTSYEAIETWGVGAAYLQPPAAIGIDDPESTAELIHDVQAFAADRGLPPLFIALDHEGGYSSFLNVVTGGTDTIGNMAIGASGDPLLAFEQYDLMGRELRAMGFNMNFAPAVDTLVVTRNGNMNTRSFGPDPALNAELATAAVAGLQKNGVIAVVKHFPGDGQTNANTHHVQVSVDLSAEELRAGSLVPFQAAVDGGAAAFMTMPARFPAWDAERPALSSRAVTTDLLRGELGFTGLICTDAVWMEGAAIGLDHPFDVAVEALAAGADILLTTNPDFDDVIEMATRIEAALDDGRLDLTAFEASTRLILEAKARFCLLEEPLWPGPDAADRLRDHVLRPEDKQLSQGHAARAMILLEDDGQALPLTGKRVLVVTHANTVAKDPANNWPNVLDRTLGDAIRGHDKEAAIVEYVVPMKASAAWPKVQEAAAQADVLVLATLNARFSREQTQLTEWILDRLSLPVVHVSVGVPFDHAQTQGRVAAALATMNARSVSLEAAADLLYGAATAGGALRYDLDAIPYGAGYGDEDRCAEQGVTCSGLGVCLDHVQFMGCVCDGAATPTDDGLDCEL